MEKQKPHELVKQLDRIAQAYLVAVEECNFSHADDLLEQFFSIRPSAEEQAGCTLKYKGIDF